MFLSAITIPNLTIKSVSCHQRVLQYCLCFLRHVQRYSKNHCKPLMGGGLRLVLAHHNTVLVSLQVMDMVLCWSMMKAIHE